MVLVISHFTKLVTGKAAGGKFSLWGQLLWLREVLWKFWAASILSWKAVWSVAWCCDGYRLLLLLSKRDWWDGAVSVETRISITRHYFSLSDILSRKYLNYWIELNYYYCTESFFMFYLNYRLILHVRCTRTLGARAKVALRRWLWVLLTNGGPPCFYLVLSCLSWRW